MSWSWQRAKSKIVSEALIGLIFGLTFGLCISPIFGLVDGLILFGSLGMVVNLLNSGLSSVEVKQKTVPNQGIWNSAKNALKLGSIEGICVGLAIVVINNVAGYPLKAANAKSVGLMLALIIGVRYGVTTCIQHFNLRQILYRKGRIPWNYARFLNYASERLLMKKVGGGYVFYHRMLMEHFARRYTETSKSIDRTSQLATQPATGDRKIAIDSSNNNGTVSQPRNLASNSLFCSSCGQQNPFNNKFCTKCGSQLTRALS